MLICHLLPASTYGNIAHFPYFRTRKTQKLPLHANTKPTAYLSACLQFLLLCIPFLASKVFQVLTSLVLLTILGPLEWQTKTRIYHEQLRQEMKMPFLVCAHSNTRLLCNFGIFPCFPYNCFLLLLKTLQNLCLSSSSSKMFFIWTHSFFSI